MIVGFTGVMRPPYRVSVITVKCERWPYSMKSYNITAFDQILQWLRCLKSRIRNTWMVLVNYFGWCRLVILFESRFSDWYGLAWEPRLGCLDTASVVRLSVTIYPDKEVSCDVIG